MFTDMDIANAKKCGENVYAKDVYSYLKCEKVNNLSTWYITLTPVYSNMLSDICSIVFSAKFKDESGRFRIKIKRVGSKNMVYLLGKDSLVRKYIYSCDCEYSLCTLISLLPLYGAKFVSKYSGDWGFLYG